jgi:ATP/maltotriose-dependent transcriptional regulator MalT
MAYAHIQLGAYDVAERALREVIGEAERLGMRGLGAWAHHHLGHALALQGSLAEGHAALAPALRLAVAQRHRKLECACRVYLAILFLRGNEAESAEREARAAAQIPDLTSSPRALALAVLGRVLLTRRRAAEALAVTEQAMRLLEGHAGAEEGESMIHLAHVEALFENGRVPEARAVAHSARARLLARAAKITDPALRESFLQRVADNARLLALARTWLGAP